MRLYVKFVHEQISYRISLRETIANLTKGLLEKYFPAKYLIYLVYTQIGVHSRWYPEDSMICWNNYSLMFSLSLQYSHTIAFLAFLALAPLRIITACFGGKLSRLRKPKYFILREARKAFMSRCKGVYVVKGVHGNLQNNSCKTWREVTLLRTSRKALE